MPWPRIYAVEKYTPRTWGMVWLAAVAWVALVLCGWQVAHGWGVFFGVAGFHFFLLGFLTGKPRRRYIEWTAILVGVAILFFLLRGHVDYIRVEQRDSYVRRQVRQLGQHINGACWNTGKHHPILLEQWATENTEYGEYYSKQRNSYGSLKTLYLHFREGGEWPADAPADAAARNIITDEYLTQAELDAMGVMHHVSMSDPEHAGNFTYIPHLERHESGEIVCTGFTLVGYGLAMYGEDNYREHLYGGNAWEHVVFVTGSDIPRGIRIGD